jgi:hypothetical protein
MRINFENLAKYQPKQKQTQWFQIRVVPSKE